MMHFVRYPARPPLPGYPRCAVSGGSPHNVRYPAVGCIPPRPCAHRDTAQCALSRRPPGRRDIAHCEVFRRPPWRNNKHCAASRQLARATFRNAHRPTARKSCKIANARGGFLFGIAHLCPCVAQAWGKQGQTEARQKYNTSISRSRGRAEYCFLGRGLANSVPKALLI